MRLVDSHAHVQDVAYERDRATVLERARSAGVIAIVTAGTDLPSSQAAVQLAMAEPLIWAAVGIHPHDAAQAPSDTCAQLEQLARSERVVAIGEIGLDFYRDLSPRVAQERVFQEQLELAGRLDLPVVVHSREAHAATLGTLQPWASSQRASGRREPLGIMHCYAYGPERLADYLQLGFAISIPGTVTYPKAAAIADAAARAPLNRLVIETDCPYLTPQSRRGRRNEPALLTETVAKIAALRDISGTLVAERTTENAGRLFRLPVLPDGTRRSQPREYA